MESRVDKPLIAHNPPIGRSRERGNGIYAADFGMAVGIGEPVFAMGGVIYGVLASTPQGTVTLGACR